jgi:seryl-tRNA synthetase
VKTPPGQTADATVGLGQIGLQWSGRGYATLTNPLLGLATACDQAILAIAAHWAAVPEQHPVLMSAEDLHPVGYLSSFPHLVTFAAPLDPAPRHLQTFAATARQDPQAALNEARLPPPGDVLTPAACYHVYVHHRDCELPAPLVVTTRNTCFRREDHYLPLRRQWSFQMREIVCIGSREEVSDFLSDTRTLVDRLVARLGLSVEWKAATDPFFNPTANPHYLAQKLHPTKHEACYRDLAIASVNMHEDHFGHAYGIGRRSRAAYSGCVAFGLERWLYALLDRWGSDPDDWPDTFTAESGP